MREIRRLTEKDLPAYYEILMHAYTGFGISEERLGIMDREFRPMLDSELNELYGVFQAGELTGGMRLINYRMELRGRRLPAGGIGSVAVGQLHKKEGTARDLIAYALEHFRRRGTAFAALHPFRVDFYHRMGFGYGSQMREYRVEPEYLPDGPNEGIEYLTPDDWLEVVDCHDRYMAGRDTLFELTAEDCDRLFGRGRKLVGYRRDGRLCGYVSVSYEKEYVFRNNLVVHELVYTDPSALAGLLGFLRRQGDQFQRVIFHTTEDLLHLLFANPANGSNAAFGSFHIEYGTDGIGVQFRVLDAAEVFRQLGKGSFGPEHLRLQINLRDEFCPANAGSTLVDFRNGCPEICPGGTADIELNIGVTEFSALVIGAAELLTLLDYGLATLSDPAYAPAVARLFRTGKKPMCNTGF